MKIYSKRHTNKPQDAVIKHEVEHDNRQMFFIDVGSFPADRINEYLAEVKKALHTQRSKDLYYVR